MKTKNQLPKTGDISDFVDLKSIIRIKSCGKPTMGKRSQNLVISDAPEHLRQSGTNEYPFDFPSPIGIKAISIMQ